MKHEQKYFKVSEIAQMFGLSHRYVGNQCRSDDGKYFSVQPVKRGVHLIDLKKYMRFYGMEAERGSR